MSYQTPYSGSLEQRTYKITMPSNILVVADTYNFKQWEDLSTSPTRTINLASDMAINAGYELVVVPPGKGNVQVHAFLNSTEIVTDGVIVELNQAFQTPATIPVDPGTYMVQVTLQGYSPISKQVTVATGQTIRADFQFTVPPPISPWWQTPAVIATIIGGIPLVLILASKFRRG